jgi:phosphoglycolate phosphatase/pyrophosphatase PpaX
VRLFEGAADMLDQLRARGVATALWTGRDRGTTEILLRQLGLNGHFTTAVCGDDLPSHKPDPAGLREILRRLGTSPAETLFVGDADVDVLGGHACGVDTIIIRHAREIAAEISAKAWQSVATPADAFSLVAKTVIAS